MSLVRPQATHKKTGLGLLSPILHPFCNGRHLNTIRTWFFCGKKPELWLLQTLQCLWQVALPAPHDQEEKFPGTTVAWPSTQGPRPHPWSN